MMRASVAMTTYNGTRYIGEQLESLWMQTHPVDEVVICDDCSSDDTACIVASFIVNHQLDNWRLQVNEANLGYAENFKQALQACTGDVVFFCDQDDIWHTDKIARCLQVMEDNPRVQVLVSEYDALISSVDAPSVSGEAAKAMTADGTLQQMIVGENAPEIWIGCAMALRREFVQMAFPFWLHSWAHDSWAWILSLAVGGCFILHESLFERRLHSENVSMHSHHDLQDRIGLLEAKLKGDQMAVAFARYCDDSDQCSFVGSYGSQFSRQAEFDGLRLSLVKDRQLGSAFKLIPKLGMYPYKRSLLMETVLALRGGAR